MSDTAAPSSSPAPNAAPPAAPPSSPGSQGGNATPEGPPSTAGGYKAFVDESNRRRQERIAKDKQDKQQQQQPPKPTAAPVPGPQNPPTPQPQATEPPTENEPPPTGEQPPQWTQQDIDDLKKYREWMSGETIPEEMLAKMVALKDGDNVDYESFEEMRNERMMQRDYSREMGKIKQERDQWAAERQAYQQHFESIGHPETGGEAMYEIFTRNGWRKQGRQMAEKYAAEEREDNLHAQGYAIAFAQQNRIYKQNAQGQWDVDWDHYDVRKAFDKARADRERQRERDDKERGRDFEIERLRGQQKQVQQQDQVNEDAARMRRQLDQLRPRAFQARGLDADNPRHMQLFNQQLHAILTLQGGPIKITPEACMSAAKAAKQELDAELKGNQPPTKQAQPFVPKRGGGAAPIANQQQGGPQGGWHIGNFQAKHGRR